MCAPWRGHAGPPLRPLFQNIDCLQIPVPDLGAGFEFYRDRLGHELIWRTETAAGLRLPESDADVVIQTERSGIEANIKVVSAEEAVFHPLTSRSAAVLS